MMSTARVSSQCSNDLPIPVGYKFNPTDKELLGYYLQNKVSGKPFEYEFKIPVENIYHKEPWDIWYMYGGPNLDESEDLYFFTELKKVSDKGSRVARTVGSGSGTWKGESTKQIYYYDSKNKKRTLGLFKRYRYENDKSDQHGCWIMHEYSLESKSSTSNVDYVLCRIRKNAKKRKLSDSDPQFKINKVQKLDNSTAEFGTAYHDQSDFTTTTTTYHYNEEEQITTAVNNNVQDLTTAAQPTYRPAGVIHGHNEQEVLMTAVNNNVQDLPTTAQPTYLTAGLIHDQYAQEEFTTAVNNNVQDFPTISQPTYLTAGHIHDHNAQEEYTIAVNNNVQDLTTTAQPTYLTAMNVGQFFSHHNEQEQVGAVNTVTAQDYLVTSHVLTQGHYLGQQGIQEQPCLFDGSGELEDLIDFTDIDYMIQQLEQHQQQQPLAPIYEDSMTMEIGESHTSTQGTMETLQQPAWQPEDGIIGDAVQSFTTESLMDDQDFWARL